MASERQGGRRGPCEGPIRTIRPSKTIRRPDGGPTLASIGRIVQNVDHPIERISIRDIGVIPTERGLIDGTDPKIIGGP